MPRRLLAVLALLFAASPLAAQDPATAPRAVADSFFRFVADERYADAARLMDLEAFDTYRAQSVKLAREQSRRPRRMTANDFRKSDPKMPRVVAEYQAKAFNERVRTEFPYTRHEFGYATIDSIASAPAPDALARWLRAHDVREMMRESLARRGTNGCPPPTKEELARLAAPLRRPPARIVGLVMEGDSVAWVLHVDPAFDPSVMDRLYPDSTVSTPSAVPLPTRPTRIARPWEEIPPSLTVLRRVGERWLVGRAIGIGSSFGFASFCESAPRTRPAKR